MEFVPLPAPVGRVHVHLAATRATYRCVPLVSVTESLHGSIDSIRLRSKSFILQVRFAAVPRQKAEPCTAAVCALSFVLLNSCI